MLVQLVQRATALAVACALATTALGQGQEDTAARAFGLRSASVTNLDLDRTAGMPVVTAITIEGKTVTLDLRAHSVRSPGYQVLHQVEGGALVPVAPGPVRTLRGSVLEVPGSSAAGAMLEDGLHVTVIIPGGQRYWIQPVAGRVPGAGPNAHVLYADADVLPSGGTCGMAHEAAVEGPPALDKAVVDLSGLASTAPADAGEPPADGGGIAGGTIYCTELACDSDFPYYQDWGAGTEARIELVINTVNAQYMSQVDIQHYITTIIVRTSDAADPYSLNTPDGLLDQFRDYWLANYANIQRDVAHLFTGRNLSGGVIGIAWTIGGICTNQAYCLSQSDCCGSFACATDLTAHELGHLWGASHCSCPTFTMNPSITCVNQFNTGSINSIVAHRNSRTCLDQGGCPDYDDCPTAASANPGTNQFDTTDASNSGPSESSCGGGGNVNNDVWFEYIATCDGPHILSLCGASFDTTLVVYEGGCPTGPGQAIACNDNQCGLGSRLQMALVGGTTYMVRIGSLANLDGTGTLAISFVCQAPCPTDLNGDGQTDVQDLTAMILLWDTSDPAADLNGDGEVGVEDLTTLILAWGPCL